MSLPEPKQPGYYWIVTNTNTRCWAKGSRMIIEFCNSHWAIMDDDEGYDWNDFDVVALHGPITLPENWP